MTLLATLLLTASPWRAPTPADHLDGLATYMNPGVMARTAANRGLIPHPGAYASWLAVHGYAGGVALNPAGDLGRVIWLEHAGRIEGPFVVLDCAQRVHYAQRIDQRRVVEVDWATAQRWRMRGPVPVVVHLAPPVGKVLERYRTALSAIPTRLAVALRCAQWADAERCGSAGICDTSSAIDQVRLRPSVPVPSAHRQPPPFCLPYERRLQRTTDYSISDILPCVTVNLEGR